MRHEIVRQQLPHFAPPPANFAQNSASDAIGAGGSGNVIGADGGRSGGVVGGGRLEEESAAARIHALQQRREKVEEERAVERAQQRERERLAGGGRGGRGGIDTGVGRVSRHSSTYLSSTRTTMHHMHYTHHTHHTHHTHRTHNPFVMRTRTNVLRLSINTRGRWTGSTPSLLGRGRGAFPNGSRRGFLWGRRSPQTSGYQSLTLLLWVSSSCAQTFILVRMCGQRPQSERETREE